jgi:integrase
MAIQVKPLSDMKIAKAKPLALKATTLFDGGGLFLLITSKDKSGKKLWRFKYTFNGKQKMLSFGSYPEVSLADARQKRADARKQVAAGIDPGEVRKAAKAQTQNTFEAIARERHEKFKSGWTAGHAERTLSRLERHVFPIIGARPIAEIKAPELLAVLHRMESQGILESAHRIKSICGQIFRYAISTGRAERDPSQDLRGALPAAKQGHLAALTDPAKVAGLLRAIDTYDGSFVVKSAMQLQALFFVRPGELRHAEWSEIDLDAALWSIPAEKMKMKQAHLVPLSRKAVELLRELQPLTGHTPFVFPSHRSSQRPMSNNAILAALRRMGYDKDEMTGHGFRAMARTILDEVLHVRTDYIEHQLAHAVRDPLGRAYNRTTHLEERKKMMQLWSDYLDGLKAGAKILTFGKRAG